jgi:hypothetical protein
LQRDLLHLRERITSVALRPDISLAGPLEDQSHLTIGEPATIGTAMVRGHVLQ